MRLETIRYSENAGTRQEWELKDLTLESLNLLVGKNSSGKTRALNVIHGLAKMLCGEVKSVLISGSYDVTFVRRGKRVRYVLNYENSAIIKEEFVVDNRKLLTRGRGGTGWISYAKKANRKLRFQTPPNELAVVSRRDSIQHPFFEDLHAWGKSVRLYQFGGTLGKYTIVFIRGREKEVDVPTNTEQVITVFRLGLRNFGARFPKLIMDHMAEIGFPLSKIELRAPVALTMPVGQMPGDPVYLCVHEKGLRGITDQHSMSQGMFRALSVIIQLTYSQMAEQTSCILIDDIGEGLDFERSRALVKLITSKFHQSSAQIIMATNDRLVMNMVPLQSWTVLKRKGSIVSVFNYANSKKIIDEFTFTGLNNFDFFATDFLSEAKMNA